MKPASEGKPLSAGMEAAMGTCHKCGGSLCRGRKEFASLCGECGTRFHSIDCGDRLQRSGYQGMSEQCPKVRLSTCATVDGRIDATLAFFRAMLNTLSQGRERVIDPLTSRRGVRRYLEACAPRIRVPARRARPPRPSAEPLGVSPAHNKKLTVSKAGFPLASEFADSRATPSSPPRSAPACARVSAVSANATPVTCAICVRSRLRSERRPTPASATTSVAPPTTRGCPRRRRNPRFARSKRTFAETPRVRRLTPRTAR